VTFGCAIKICIADDFLRLLLAKGYIPEELPPVFTSQSFGNFASKNPKAFEPFASKPNRLKAIDYSASKAGFRRRPFVVTHPVAQFFVANFVTNNWKAIEAQFKASASSLSIPTKDEDGTRAIEITPFPELHRLMHERLGQYGYVAKSDIQRFYQSIYTHSIPWAVHGKAAVKKDGNANSAVVTFNKLDQLVRRGQDGQTIGIPIGPDTSRIIGEIVGCAIDKRIELSPVLKTPS